MKASFKLTAWDRHDHRIHVPDYFFSLTGILPDSKIFRNVNFKKLTLILDTQTSLRLIRRYSFEKEDEFFETKVSRCFVYHFEDNIFIMTNNFFAAIYYSPEEMESAKYLSELCRKCRKRHRFKAEINLVVPGAGSFTTTEIDIRKPKMELDEFYGIEFKTRHQQFLKSLKKKNTSGLYLFHGAPGTGKSTYIRYLIHQIGKKIIFIPPGIAASLDNPSFTELLIENAESVFVIEDAENLIVSRNHNENSGISMLLNLTDGLLGESLGIQCIATFNTAVSKIDPALMRKGRLLGMHCFAELPGEQDSKLISRLHNREVEVRSPMSLSEIFHYDGNGLQEYAGQRAIGFGR